MRPVTESPDEPPPIAKDRNNSRRAEAMTSERRKKFRELLESFRAKAVDAYLVVRGIRYPLRGDELDRYVRAVRAQEEARAELERRYDALERENERLKSCLKEALGSLADWEPTAAVVLEEINALLGDHDA